MGKVAILTDSNSGITQAEGARTGIYVLPMPFYINDEMLFEEIDLVQEEFYEKLTEGAQIKTSMPTVGSVTDMWKKLLKEHDEIVYIPMSSGLSGSCETAYMLSQDPEFDEKVYVVDNQRISVTQRQSVYDAKMLADEGKSAVEIRDILMEEKFQSSIYIMVDTLTYLKRGGRITPAAAALGTLLKLKPVLQIQGEKLDAFAKARTVKQAKSIMIEAMKKDFAERFHDASGGNIAQCRIRCAAPAAHHAQIRCQAHDFAAGAPIATEWIGTKIKLIFRGIHLRGNAQFGRRFQAVGQHRVAVEDLQRFGRAVIRERRRHYVGHDGSKLRA